ncbi:protein-lysine N-methyltransferase EEF2KMT [Diorhabda carinulata]|uniref:protein-lysine N-methyltransferase EEF2KMT n=1 Tax=Diorhabda carinulata TaxID=1163345 RepID=UPI0025A21D87|nr:protein-lysine N-methyltransferase EEF2KMT [Diorhabda carinulata]
MSQDFLLEKIDKISKQFICNVPLTHFDWQNIFDSFLTENIQEYLLNKTVNSEIVLKFPLQISYQKSFLKHILTVLESETNLEEPVIHDDIYSAYGRLVATQDTFRENYKHYLLCNENKFITLKESNSLISDGTTGLRTWQASLALSEWIIQNKNVFDDKNVLELGSGVGLTGLVLKQVCSVNNIYLTDCHEAVLGTLVENVKLNLLNNGNEDNVYYQNPYKRSQSRFVHTDNNTTIQVLNLPWEKVSSDICEELGTIHKVIAADIIYDDFLFEPLVTTLKCLKENCSVEEFIFACTERNPVTLEKFLELISKTFHHIQELPVPCQSNFFWSLDTPIKIYLFKD